MEEAKQIAEWLDALDRPNKQMLRAAVDGLIAALPDSPETGKNLQDLLRDSQRRNRWPIAYILAHLPNHWRSCSMLLTILTQMCAGPLSYSWHA